MMSDGVMARSAQSQCPSIVKWSWNSRLQAGFKGMVVANKNKRTKEKKTSNFFERPAKEREWTEVKLMLLASNGVKVHY